MSCNVYTGCQSSGKTIENVTNATKWVDVLDCEGLFVHNRLDTRDPKNIVSSNSSSYGGISKKFHIVTCETLAEIDHLTREYSIISIDEVQFFPDIVHFVKKWLDEGKHIFCSGLNTNWKGEDFGDVKELLKYATTFKVLTSKCSWCRDEFKLKGLNDVIQIPDACRTAKIGGSNSIIETGGKEMYIPLCYKHHKEYLSKNPDL